MKIVACSQARLGSTRLPGKVLLPVNGKNLLEYHISRVSQASKLTEHVIATSDADDDNDIAYFCEQLGIRVVRGSKHNVLQRFNNVLTELALEDNDRLIRLTGDCPLVDGRLIDALIDYHIDNNEDYTSINTGENIRGFDAEIMSIATLKHAVEKATLEYEFEHVTPYVYQHPELFKCGQYRALMEVKSAARLCIDEPADLQMFKQLVELYPAGLITAGSAEIMAFLAEHPALTEINLHVHQKRLGE